MLWKDYVKPILIGGTCGWLLGWTLNIALFLFLGEVPDKE